MRWFNLTPFTGMNSVTVREVDKKNTWVLKAYLILSVIFPRFQVFFVLIDSSMVEVNWIRRF
jgi:hypothetical protein